MKSDTLSLIGSLVIIVSFIVFCIGAMIYPYATADTIEFTVEEKTVVISNSKSKYLIFTTDEVLQNKDSIMRWKFNSSDIQRELKEGSTYKADIYGWRVPFFSMYKNIVSVQKVE